LAVPAYAFVTSSWNGTLVYRGGGSSAVETSQLTW
jgi:hypothetical protein